MMKEYCEYTQLSITTRTHWQNLVLKENFKTSFSLIGDAILLSEPDGPCDKEGMRKYLIHKNRFLREYLPGDKSYVEIQNYAGLNYLPPGRVRSLFTKSLKKELGKGKLKGFIGFNAPPSIRWLFNLKLPVAGNKTMIVKDYKQAVDAAFSLLGRTAIPVRTVEDEQMFSRTEIQEHIENILQYMESTDKAHEQDIDPTHPFKILYDLISVIKMDFQTMLAQEKQKTRLLTANEEKYRVLSENLQDVIFIIDHGFKLKSIAGNTLFTLGYSKPELESMKTGELIALFHPTDLPQVMQKVQVIHTENKKQIAEIRLKQPDNSYRWTEWTFVPLLKDDKILNIHCSARNIEQQKLNEQKLNVLQQQLVDTALQAGKVERTTGIMHDIGNILNGVNICVENLNNRLTRMRIEKLARVSELITSNLGRAHDFFNTDTKGKIIPEYLKNLALSMTSDREKMQEEVRTLRTKMIAIKEVIMTQQKYNHSEQKLEKFELGTTIDDALTLQSSVLVHHGIRVEKAYPGEQQFFVKAQRSKLIHVLINLLKNASEAMADIPVVERKIKIGLDTGPQEKIIITVADKGKGIPPGKLEDIFRYGVTTKKNGHGFGLHTSKNYIKEMGGKLFARSDGEGRGTEFIIELPHK